MLAQEPGHLFMCNGVARVKGREMFHQACLVKLGPAGKNGRCHRDAHASSQVPKQVIDRGRLGHPLFRYMRERQGGERDEGHAHAESQCDAGPDKGPEVRREIEPRHHVRAERADGHADNEKPLRVHLPDELPHERHGDHGGEASRTEHEPCIERCVAHHHLEKYRKQYDAAEEVQKNEEHHRAAGGERPVLEQLQVDDGVL